MDMVRSPISEARQKTGEAREGNAQGGLARLAQARQNRPGTGELDLTNIGYVWIGLVPIQSDYERRPCGLPTIPQKGRDIEIVAADRRLVLAGVFRLTRLNVSMNADRFRGAHIANRLRTL